MTSAFTTQRALVLGHYSTASWLRQLVLAMWNGTDYQVGLSTLATVDDWHAAAALEMIRAYRQHGERDPAFMALAKACLARQGDEAAATSRAMRFEQWCDEAQRAAGRAGARAYFVDDHYGWFERQFDAGMASEAAASLALVSNLDSPREQSAG